MVSVDDKVTIGDFLWLDKNRNGLQDDGGVGVKNVTVTLYTANGDVVATTTSGNMGEYNFEVCPNSGEYYIVFGDVPQGLSFTGNDAGDDAFDSDANNNGQTAVFVVADMDNPTIDAGFVKDCNLVADAGADVKICTGEEVMLTATGGVNYLWSTGETTASIKVSPTVDSVYTVTVSDFFGCSAIDEVKVSVDAKVNIGDFVWLDENRNGLQDDGATGVNGVKVTLHTCDGDVVATTMTDDNGAYNFEVCPNSGEYYVVFGDIPVGTKFTSSNSGDDTMDSDANDNGRTACFEVADAGNLTIDAGLVEDCNLKIDAGADASICVNETIEITASLIDNTEECPSVCVYPIKDQERCSGLLGNYEIFLLSTIGNLADARFKTSEQNLVRYADNTMRYTATASNGMDTVTIDALYTGYTTNAPVGSPRENNCQEYGTEDWEYWTTWSGTLVSENHGTYSLSTKGAAFQMGLGADVMRTGLGASGWFFADGGDGFYVDGDVNVTFDPCVETGVMYQWSTEDGNIVGNANQKTIKVDAAGTYFVEAINCIDCVDTDKIVVTADGCPSGGKSAVAPTPVMTSVYPVPVQSGGKLTIEFEIPSESNDELVAIPLMAAVDYIERKEDVGITLYDMLGRAIGITKTFKIIDGKATIYLDLDAIPTGKYIVRAQGSGWSDAKNIIVR